MGPFAPEALHELHHRGDGLRAQEIASLVGGLVDSSGSVHVDYIAVCIALYIAHILIHIDVAFRWGGGGFRGPPLDC